MCESLLLQKCKFLQVISILKAQYERFRIRHASVEFLRRGSRAPPSMYAQIIGQQQNGYVTSLTCNESVHLAPTYPAGYKTSNGSVVIEPYPKQQTSADYVSQVNPAYMASNTALSGANKETTVVTESTSLLPASRPSSAQRGYLSPKPIEESEDEMGPPPPYSQTMASLHRSNH